MVKGYEDRVPSKRSSNNSQTYGRMHNLAHRENANSDSLSFSCINWQRFPSVTMCGVGEAVGNQALSLVAGGNVNSSPTMESQLATFLRRANANSPSSGIPPQEFILRTDSPIENHNCTRLSTAVLSTVTTGKS